MKSGLTISLIFEAQSANYGEGFGNITSLKQLSRSGGNVYTYISRQAIRYNMIEQLGWDNTPVEASGSGDKTVIQYQPKAFITDYPEIDLFGYMKTEKKIGAVTRAAIVRLSNAISLEPYHSDMDFLTNMGLAKRTDANNSIAQSEIHKSFYAYTITIDLDKVGIDSNTEEQVTNQEKASRVTKFISAVQYLYRDIKGRRENLSPLFAIGGLYSRKCPFFENRLKLDGQNLDLEMITDTLMPIKDDTLIGYVAGTFHNDNNIKETLTPLGISLMFDQLRSKIEVYYNESN